MTASTTAHPATTVTAALRRLLLRELGRYGLVTALVVLVLAVPMKFGITALYVDGEAVRSLSGLVATCLLIAMATFGALTTGTHLIPALAAGATRRAAVCAFLQVGLLASLLTGVLVALAAAVPAQLMAPWGGAGSPVEVSVVGLVPSLVDSAAIFPLLAALAVLVFLLGAALLPVVFRRVALVPAIALGVVLALVGVGVMVGNLMVAAGDVPGPAVVAALLAVAATLGAALVVTVRGIEPRPVTAAL